MKVIMPNAIYFGMEQRETQQDRTPYGILRFSDVGEKPCEIFCEEDKLEEMRKCDPLKPYQVSVDMYVDWKGVLRLKYRAIKPVNQ